MRKLVLVLMLALGSAPLSGRAFAASGSANEGRSGQDAAEKTAKAVDRVPGGPGEAHAAVRAEPVEVRREYRISLGPWSGTLSVPDSIDLLELADRARGFLGIIAIMGTAVFLSDNRRAISRRVVFWGLVLQWGFAILVLRVPAGIRAMRAAGAAIQAILDCALEGAGWSSARR